MKNSLERILIEYLQEIYRLTEESEDKVFELARRALVEAGEIPS